LCNFWIEGILCVFLIERNFLFYVYFWMENFIVNEASGEGKSFFIYPRFSYTSHALFLSCWHLSFFFDFFSVSPMYCKYYFLFPSKYKKIDFRNLKGFM
jgi:hypothetical protein